MVQGKRRDLRRLKRLLACCGAGGPKKKEAHHIHYQINKHLGEF